MIRPKQALAATNRLQAAYQQSLARVIAGVTKRFIRHFKSGKIDIKAQQLPVKLRGLFEPFARSLLQRQLALSLAAQFIASREKKDILELQAADIRVLFRLPPREAISFLLGKKVLTRDEFDRLTAAEQIRAFTVSRVTERRLLDATKQSIARSLVAGTPRRELIQNLSKILPHLTRSRLELIAHQNLRQAAMAGRFEQMMRSRDVLPFVQWKTMGDDRVREDHAVLHDQVWPLDEMPFWPPLGFNCRCWTIQLSKTQIPSDKRVIRGPGRFKSSIGKDLIVSANNQYSLPNRPLQFEFTNMPIRHRQALDISRQFRNTIFARDVFTDIPAQDVSNYKKFLGPIFKAEAAEVRRTIESGESFFVYNASPSQLYSIPPQAEEMFIDIHQYTQNDHFITTFVEKALKAGITRDQIELHFKASTMEGAPYKQSTELFSDNIRTLLRSRSTAEVTRSTEFVLRIRDTDATRLRTLALDTLDVAEKHGTTSRAMRVSSEAWLESDIRIVGLGKKIIDRGFAEQWGQAPTHFKQVFVYYRRIGKGEIVKLYKREKNRHGWDGHYPILVPTRLWELIE